MFIFEYNKLIFQTITDFLVKLKTLLVYFIQLFVILGFYLHCVDLAVDNFYWTIWILSIVGNYAFSSQFKNCKIFLNFVPNSQILKENKYHVPIKMFY